MGVLKTDRNHIRDMKNPVQIQNIITEIAGRLNLKESGVKVIAIDGRCASGKTTLAKELAEYQAALQDTQTQLESAKAEMETPFAKEAELAEKSARLKELNILLNMDQKDKALLDEAPEDSPDKEKSRSVER